jgi:hypothetical protein
MSIEHRWNDTDKENPKVFGGKTAVVSLCPPQIVTRADLGSNPDSSVQRPATSFLSHAAACSVSTIYSRHFWRFQQPHYIFFVFLLGATEAIPS